MITYPIALAQGRRPANLELMGAAIVLVTLIANNLHQRSKIVCFLPAANGRESIIRGAPICRTKETIIWWNLPWRVPRISS